MNFPQPAVTAVIQADNQNDTPLAGALRHPRRHFTEEDKELYIQLPEAVREEFNAICSWLETILGAKSRSKACRNVATIINVPAGGLYKRIQNYLASNDWRHLVNKAKAGALLWETRDQVGLPRAFRQFVQGLCEDNQRVDTWGLEEAVRIWRTRYDSRGNHYDTIPGYSKWPEPAPLSDVPHGWSERNLRRFCAPDKWDATAARVGLAAASKHRPPVFSTRVGLRLLERIELDDHEYNIKIHFPGQPKAFRPRGFNAVDTLTANPFATCFKPTRWDMEDEKRIALTEVDAMWFVLLVLNQHGFRTDEKGTWLIMEHGLTTVPEAVEKAIYEVTGCKVQIDRSGRFGKASHSGKFDPAKPGKGKGNFRFKPLVEGTWRMADDFFAWLPGQVGKDRNFCPEELAGRESYLKWLLEVAPTLPPERAQHLMPPVLTYNQFLNHAVELYGAFSRNIAHDIGDWDKCGFEIAEWRINSGLSWLPMSQLQALPPAERLAVEAVIHNPPNKETLLTRTRKLSRAEAFLASSVDPAITRLSLKHTAQIVGIKHGRELVVKKNSTFEFDDQEMGGEFQYWAVLDDGRHLRPGEKYLCFVNPLAPQLMQVCRSKGEHVGLCELVPKPCKTDFEGLQRQAGKQQQWTAQRQAGMELRHTGEAAERAHMVAHNEAVVAGKPITAEEKDRCKEIATNVRRHGKAAAEAILVGCERTQSEEEEQPKSSAGSNLLNAL